MRVSAGQSVWHSGTALFCSLILGTGWNRSLNSAREEQVRTCLDLFPRSRHSIIPQLFPPTFSKGGNRAQLRTRHRGSRLLAALDHNPQGVRR